MVDDAVQDTYLRLVGSELPDNYEAHILQAAKWTALNYHRGYKRFVSDIDLNKFAAPESEFMDLESLSSKLRDNVTRLPKKQRALIEARLNNVGPTEYAKIHKLNVNSVTPNYQHALKNLKVLMGA